MPSYTRDPQSSVASRPSPCGIFPKEFSLVTQTVQLCLTEAEIQHRKEKNLIGQIIFNECELFTIGDKYLKHLGFKDLKTEVSFSASEMGVFPAVTLFMSNYRRCRTVNFRIIGMVREEKQSCENWIITQNHKQMASEAFLIIIILKSNWIICKYLSISIWDMETQK